ncbi:MAG: glycosyltransferase [Spongiibacteraceae bacterium]
MAGALLARGIRSEIRIAGAATGGQFYLEELKQRAKALGVEDCITFLGGLSELEIKQELEKAQIFILPSRDEPLGVAYMEAMSMELPTVGYAAGGVPELISDKENGFLCPLQSLSCLADTVEYIIKNRDRIEMIRVQARSTIIANYDSSIGAKKMADLFAKKSIGLV